MSESRIRRAKSKGYFALNREPAQDDRLSLEARGLYALMMSLPEDWEYTVSGMAVKAGCGKSKIRRCLKELEDVGYLLREQSHDSGGKFSGNIYILQEFSPLSENTDNGKNRQRVKPSSDFGTQQNIDLTEEENKKPPIVPPEGNGKAEEKKTRYSLQEDAKPILRAYVGDDKELRKKLGKFINMREELKAINSKDGIVSLLKKLDKLSGGQREMKLILIDEAMANSWKSVFPLRGDENTKGGSGQPPPTPMTPERFGWD